MNVESVCPISRAWGSSQKRTTIYNTITHDYLQHQYWSKILGFVLVQTKKRILLTTNSVVGAQKRLSRCRNVDHGVHTIVVTQGHVKHGLKMKRNHTTKKTSINPASKKDTYLTDVLYHRQWYNWGLTCPHRQKSIKYTTIYRITHTTNNAKE